MYVRFVHILQNWYSKRWASVQSIGVIGNVFTIYCWIRILSPIQFIEKNYGCLVMKHTWIICLLGKYFMQMESVWYHTYVLAIQPSVNIGHLLQLWS